MMPSRDTMSTTGGSSPYEAQEVKIAFQDTYRILGLAGHGAFGKVFKVSALHDGDYFALKILKSEFLPNKTDRERFAAEFEVLSRIRHKNIVRVHEAGTIPSYGFSYFTMDWVEGGSLAVALKENHKFDSADVKVILSQLLSALGHLQVNKIVHRDIKPGNVLIDSNRHAYLIADFGLAKMVEASLVVSGGNGTRYWAGTWPYMAPEQFENAGKVDIQSDLYSLGVLGIELLTGSLPGFTLSQDDPIAARYSADLQDLENWLRQFAPNCSLPAVLRRAVEPDRYKRWGDPVDMKHCLWN